jgi:hypothetical protein
MYAVVRTYEMSEDWDDTLRTQLAENFVPSVERLAGFVSYRAIEGDKRLFCSITVFEDKAGAEESNRLAAEYVQRHLADRFPTSPEIIQGPVAVSSRLPAKS